MTEVKVGGIVLLNLTEFPSDPQEGMLVLVNNELYYFDGANWRKVALV